MTTDEFEIEMIEWFQKDTKSTVVDFHYKTDENKIIVESEIIQDGEKVRKKTTLALRKFKRMVKKRLWEKRARENNLG